MSHSIQPVRGAHGSTRKVKGSAIMRKSPPPSISAMPNPPPGVKTGNTVLCAVSLASSVVVIEQPLRITAAASFAITVFPRRMPCWSGNDRRTTSSPCSSIHLSARAAASNCSSFHKPWRSTKLRAVLSCDDDTRPPNADRRKVSAFIRAVREAMRPNSVHACGLRLQARDEIARSLHGQALMIKAQPVKPAQLATRSGVARSAVIALRHDDAVAGMGGCDRGIDRKNAAMARSDLAHDADEKILVLAVDRSDQRASSARDQAGRILFIAIGQDGRGRAEHFDLVHHLRAARLLELEQGRRDERRFILVDAVECRSIGAPADDRSLGRQAPNA